MNYKHLINLRETITDGSTCHMVSGWLPSIQIIIVFGWLKGCYLLDRYYYDIFCCRAIYIETKPDNQLVIVNTAWYTISMIIITAIYPLFQRRVYSRLQFKPISDINISYVSYCTKKRILPESWHKLRSLEVKQHDANACKMCGTLECLWNIA